MLCVSGRGQDPEPTPILFHIGENKFITQENKGEKKKVTHYLSRVLVPRGTHRKRGLSH